MMKENRTVKRYRENGFDVAEWRVDRIYMVDVWGNKVTIKKNGSAVQGWK